MATGIKKELKKLQLNDIRVIADLESDKQHIPHLKKEQEKANLEIVEKINLQRGKLHYAVNKIADNLILLYKSKMDQNCDILDKREKEMQQRIEVISEHKSKVTAILKGHEDANVLERAARLEELDEKMSDFDDLEKVTYKPGMIDSPKLTEMMVHACSTCRLPEKSTITSKEGKSAQHCVNTSASSVVKSSDFLESVHPNQQSLEVRKRATFQCSKSQLEKSYACEIWPTEKRFTWINCANKNKLKLFDVDGRIESILKPENHLGGMFVTPAVTDSMLFCSYDEMCIKQLTGPELQVSTVFSTKPLHPRCVCRSWKDKEIHVTLVDRNDFQITPRSTRCVATFKNSEETRRMEKDKFGDAIFVKPSRVKLNKTGDILAVINRTDEDNTHLVLLNKDLTLMLRYLGHNIVLNDRERFQCRLYKPEKPYTVNDFEFTIDDNLLVSEHYSRCVQLLTADCQHLMTVVSQSEVVPYSLACFRFRMWVGYFDGRVNVYDMSRWVTH